jgi:hypothetical protein
MSSDPGVKRRPATSMEINAKEAAPIMKIIADRRETFVK